MSLSFSQAPMPLFRACTLTLVACILWRYSGIAQAHSAWMVRIQYLFPAGRTGRACWIVWPVHYSKSHSVYMTWWVSSTRPLMGPMADSNLHRRAPRFLRASCWNPASAMLFGGTSELRSALANLKFSIRKGGSREPESWLLRSCKKHLPKVQTSGASAHFSRLKLRARTAHPTPRDLVQDASLPSESVRQTYY